jgi:hypothetical protein
VGQYLKLNKQHIKTQLIKKHFIIKIISLTTWHLNGFFFKNFIFCCSYNSFSTVFDTTLKGKDGRVFPTQQHHSQQKGSGPIFEIKQTTHQNPINKKALHPHGKKKNPNNPVNRKEWNKDRPAINKERLKRLEKLEKDQK